MSVLKDERGQVRWLSGPKCLSHKSDNLSSIPKNYSERQKLALRSCPLISTHGAGEEGHENKVVLQWGSGRLFEGIPLQVDSHGDFSEPNLASEKFQFGVNR